MTQSLDRYVAEYENARGTRSNGQPAWFARVQSDALTRFCALGFPTTRDEEWRFTNVAPIVDRAFTLGAGPAEAGRVDLAGFRLPRSLSAEVVFINGHYAPTLSTFAAVPQATAIDSLASALRARAGDIEPYLTRLASPEQQAFTSLNTAFLADGACIQIPDRARVENPIHVLFVSTRHPDGRATMSHPRVLVVLGDGSQASIVESYVGPDGAAYFTNAVTEIVLGDNAVLDHYKVQRESSQACHIGAVHVRAARNANCTSHAISLGGSLVRNDVFAVLDGEGAECTLNGLYLADDQRLVDNHTTIDHAKPHCGSREIYKGVLADRARGVFNGKIIVRPDAQKTDAKQTNRALLLSEEAQINTKPQLEIFANDVKCTHGAAVGQLDEEAVFYLRARGLAESEARRMLIHAFAVDVLDRMPLQSLRAGAEQVLQHRLARALSRAA